jgi:hypothetical protein
MNSVSGSGWTTSIGSCSPAGRFGATSTISRCTSTSNPTIFDHAIGETTAYDAAIQLNARRRVSGEALFLELAFDDLRNAADLFQPTFEGFGWRGWLGIDGGFSAAGSGHEENRRTGAIPP